MRNKIIFPAIIVVVIIVIVYVALLWITVFNSSKYQPQKSDCIIVLGYSLEDGTMPSNWLKIRMTEALKLYNGGYAKTIIVTGGRGPADSVPVALSMKKWLIDAGVPRDSILTDEKSSTTYENFVFAKSICVAKGLKTAIVVTNDFHIHRAMVTGQEFFNNLTGSPAKLTLSFDKILSYMKEPISLLKYYFKDKNTSEKILSKNTEIIKPDTKPIDTSSLAKKIATDNKNKITTYKIDVDFNAKTGIMKGKEKITFTNNNSNSINNVMLNLYHNRYSDMYPVKIGTDAKHDVGYININSVSKNGTNYKYSNLSSYININTGNINPNETVELTIGFDAYIPKSNSSTSRDANGMWAVDFFPTISNYTGGKFVYDTYYPFLESANDKISNYDVTFTIPANYSVISAGTSKDDLTGDKKVTAITAHMVRNFAFAITKNYKSTLLKALNDVNITMYNYKDHDNIYELLYTAKQGITFFDDNIGSYPYKKLVLVECNIGKPVCYVGSGIIFVDSSFMEDKNVDFSILNGVCRQWFGEIVQSNQNSENWLTTGVIDGLTEDIKGHMANESEYYDKEQKLLEDDLQNLTVKKIDTPVSFYVNRIDYDDTQHIKPMLMMYKLKDIMKDSYYEFLREYFASYAFHEPSKEDFMSLAEKQYGSSLTEFFNNWLENMDIPS